MSNLAAVNAVLQHQIERATGEFLAAVLGAVGPNPSLAPYPRAYELVLERTNGLERKVTPINIDNGLGPVVIDDQLAVFYVIPERRHAAHPHALFLGSSDLVAHTLTDDLAFKLSEGQQHIQRQPSHAGSGVELLGYRYERDATAVEDLHEFGKIGQRSRQPVDLIHNAHVDLAGSISAISLFRAGRSIVPRRATTERDERDSVVHIFRGCVNFAERGGIEERNVFRQGISIRRARVQHLSKAAWTPSTSSWSISMVLIGNSQDAELARGVAPSRRGFFSVDSQWRPYSQHARKPLPLHRSRHGKTL